MTEYVIDFEDGTTDAFDNVTDPNTHILVDATGAIIYSKGMRMSYDTDQEYGELTASGVLSSMLPASVLRFRLYFDFNGWIGSGGYAVNWFVDVLTNDATPKRLFRLYMYANNGGSSFAVGWDVFVDSGGSYGGGSTFTVSGETMVEVQFTPGTGTDGTFTIWVDGTQRQNWTNIDWDTNFSNLDVIKFGQNTLTDTQNQYGTSAYIKYDDFVINDTGDYIGPAPPLVTSSQDAYISATGALLNPDGDVTTGVWLTEADTTPLWPSLQPMDSLYVYDNNTQVGDYFEVAVEDPAAVQEGQWSFDWRPYKENDTMNIQLSCQLRQGASTVIATDTQWLTTSATVHLRRLTSAEQASITNYNDLRIRVTVEDVSMA